MPDENMEKLLEQSSSTDVQVLLAAKENAKRALLDDPSQANLAALERASRMVESAVQSKTNLKDWRAVLAYVDENGRKLGKTKLFEDIKKGRLKRQPDGTFKQRDVDRYMATLPFSGTPDSVAEKAADRQRRKEEADIRRAEAAAKREEFDLAVKMGKYIPKEQVHLELAARAVALAAGLKTAFEARNLDFVAAVDGNPKKAPALLELLAGVQDEALNEYSREMEFQVTFVEESGEESPNV